MGWFSKSTESVDLASKKESPAETPENYNALLEESLTPTVQTPEPQESPEDHEEALRRAELAKKEEEYLAFSHTQRLGMASTPRIVLTMLTASGYGVMSGFYNGFQVGSLQYLALNAHRLPKTKGGWYFYHKRKNYVVMKEALTQGVKVGGKYAAASVTYFGIEAYLDHVRGRIDFLSTATAAVIMGGLYSASCKLTLRLSGSLTNSFFSSTE